MRFGVVPKKTHKITFPENLDRKFYRDFIWDYIDGDGTFYLALNNQYAMDIEGIQDFLESIRKILQSELAVYKNSLVCSFSVSTSFSKCHPHKKLCYAVIVK